MASTTKPGSALKVGRAELRQNQSKILRKARGRQVVEVAGPGPSEGKYIVDKEYFDRLVETLGSAVETLQIMADPELYARLLRAQRTAAADLRAGKLHSLDDVFAEERR